VRTHRQLVVYQSILQVLYEPGCPLCRLLKEYQDARLQKWPDAETHRLCNFHAWGWPQFKKWQPRPKSGATCRRHWHRGLIRSCRIDASG